MKATQSRRASGSWRRNGQFAALRYVSRHLEIDAGLNMGDSVEWERGKRWELLRAGEEPSSIEGNTCKEGASATQPVPQRDAKRESGTAGWPRC